MNGRREPISQSHHKQFLVKDWNWQGCGVPVLLPVLGGKMQSGGRGGETAAAGAPPGGAHRVVSLSRSFTPPPSLSHFLTPPPYFFRALTPSSSLVLPHSLSLSRSSFSFPISFARSLPLSLSHTPSSCTPPPPTTSTPHQDQKRLKEARTKSLHRALKNMIARFHGKRLRSISGWPMLGSFKISSTHSAQQVTAPRS